MDILTFAIAFVVALVLALLITPWIAVLAKKFGAMQLPPAQVLQKIQEQRERGLLSDAEYEAKLQAARRRLDKPPLIMWGGIAYVVPFLLVSGVILLTSKVINLPVPEFTNYLLWFATIGVLFVMGILDDVFEFPGKVQLIFHLLATLLFVLSPIDFDGFRNPLSNTFVNLDWWHLVAGSFPWQISLVFPGDFVLFFWIWPMIMALKMQAGSDGLMEGNVAIGAFMLFLVSFFYGQPASALFSITLSGAMLGFLYFNFYPTKILSGSAGKSVVGFILAGLSVISNSKFAISLVIFALPLFDMFWVYLRRILYYRPRSIKQLLLISDRFHFHHSLMKLGFSETKIALIEYGITLGLGLLAVFAPPQFKPMIIIGSWGFVASLIIFVTSKANAV